MSERRLGPPGSGTDSPCLSAVDDALIEAYEAHFDAVYAYCLGRLFMRELAEDAASTVFVRLIERRRKPDVLARDDLEAWLYAAAADVASGMMKSAARRREISQDVAREKERSLAARRDGPEDLPALDWPTLYKAIHRLDLKFQDVLVLRYFGGLEIPTIAQIVRKPPQTVRTLLWRAIRMLKRQMEAQNDA